MIPHRKIEAKRRTNDPTRNGAEHSDDTVLAALIWRSELPAIVWLTEFPQRPEPWSASVGARMTGWPPLVYSTSRKPSDPTTHCWQVRTLTMLVSKRMSWAWPQRGTHFVRSELDSKGDGTAMWVPFWGYEEERLERQVRTNSGKKKYAQENRCWSRRLLLALLSRQYQMDWRSKHGFLVSTNPFLQGNYGTRSVFY